MTDATIPKKRRLRKKPASAASSVEPEKKTRKKKAKIEPEAEPTQPPGKYEIPGLPGHRPTFIADDLKNLRDDSMVYIAIPLGAFNWTWEIVEGRAAEVHKRYGKTLPRTVNAAVAAVKAFRLVGLPPDELRASESAVEADPEPPKPKIERRVAANTKKAKVMKRKKAGEK